MLCFFPMSFKLAPTSSIPSHEEYSDHAAGPALKRAIQSALKIAFRKLQDLSSGDLNLERSLSARECVSKMLMLVSRSASCRGGAANQSRSVQREGRMVVLEGLGWPFFAAVID
jgi:hypothetical protein